MSLVFVAAIIGIATLAYRGANDYADLRKYNNKKMEELADLRAENVQLKAKLKK